MGGILALLLTGMGSLALGVAQRSTHQVFTEALVAPTGPSPLSSFLFPTNSVASTVSALTAPGLMRVGSSGQPVLGLASSFRKEAGGTRWAFTLPRGGRWSDGAPLTTRDVGFTLAVLQTTGFANSALAAPWVGVSLRASSYWSGVFVLPGPAPNFPATAELPILPQAPYHDRPSAYIHRGGRPTGRFPPSAGPFTVVANTPDQVVLSRNPRYRPQPHLSRFVIQLEPDPAAVDSLLAKGQVDGWLAETPQELSGLPPGLVKRRILTYSFVEMLFNEGRPPLNSMAVRQAIAAVVNRAEVVSKALHGLGRPQYGPLPDSIAWASLRGSPVATRESPATLMASAGYQRSGPLGYFSHGGRPLTLTLSVPDVQPLPQVASALAAQLQSAGLPVTVRTHAAAGYVGGQLAKGDFQMAVVGFDNGPTPDLASLFGAVPGGSTNLSQAPTDPILNHQLDQLSTAKGGASRAAAYREVVLRLHADMPAVFLYTPEVVFVHVPTAHTPRVTAIGDPGQLFAGVAAWTD